MQCYIPATVIIRITYILQYIPKAFAFPKITTKYYQQQAIGDIIAIMKYPLKTLIFFTYGDITKTKSIILPTSCKEAHPILACKFWHYPQYSHRVKMKLFNTKISSAQHHHLQGWNWFHNIRGCSHKSQHPHSLQESSFQHIPD